MGSAACNGQPAMEFLVDMKVGPMRLLQFIDGTLVNLREDINSIVPGLFTLQGTINTSVVNHVTEADVDAIMLVSGVANRTNKEEIWDLCQNYQRMLGVTLL